VRDLTDRAGPRLAGSTGDTRAVAWALETMRALGLARVRAEPARVPVWRRGPETGEVTAPRPHTLSLTALGGSVGTLPGGLEAEVLEVPSLEALAARGSRVRGRIVFFNRRMERSADGRSYGPSARIRATGASLAARHGAVGMLMRSAGTSRARFPHTGSMRYEPGVPRIPAAALANPDADLLERLGHEGPVRVRFRLGCQSAGEAESANVVGEIEGRERPGEIVLLGAHLDSWDLGTGALDDGAGCAIVLEAARLIAATAPRPRRTVRVVLFANEEGGLSGAFAYARAHAAELASHVAALEADSGTGRPRGLGYNAGPGAARILARVRPVLVPLGAASLDRMRFGGADLLPLLPAGVPLLGVRQDMTRYFDYHHSADDTYDKIDPRALDAAAAAVAVVAYALAESEEVLPRIPEGRRKLPDWAR
jgi:hypothetical protein